MKAARHIRSISDLRPGDHVCCFLESEEERLAVIRRFIGDGLEKRDRVLYIFHGRTRQEVLEMLEAAGIAHRDHVAGGALVLASSTEMYLEGGSFDRGRMLHRLRGEIDGALSAGYRALRVTGEMGWTREASLEPGALLRYESEADALLGGAECTALCQYTEGECGEIELLALLEAHPLIAVGTEVFSNPFFSPGNASFSGDSQFGFLRKVIQRIKERELADGSLERERAKALEYFEVAGTMLVALDREGKISSINRKGLEILGYEAAEELIGRSWFDTWIPEESREEVRGVFRRLMLGEGVALRRYDNPVITSSGEKRLISWFNVVLTDPNGRPTGTLGSGDDVTEERRSLELLGIQRRLAVRSLDVSGVHETARIALDAMLDATGFDGGGVYVVDETDGALRLVHHSGLSEEFIGEVSTYAPGSPNWWLVSEGSPVYFDYLDGQLPLSDAKTREGIKSIAVIPLVHSEALVGCVNAASHTVEAVSWQAREAVEALAAQVGLVMNRAMLYEKLEASEVKYRELVEAANSIILKIDAKGAITYMNEFAQAFFGFAEDEVLGRSIVGTIVPETDSAGRDLAAMVRDVFENPAAYVNNENENVKKNGERVRLAWTNRPVLDEGGGLAGMLAVGNDVTERWRAEEERVRLRRELAAVEERWERSLERLDECMFIIDDEFTILQCNAACGRLVGADHSSLIGGKCYQYVHGTDSPPGYCATVRAVRERAEVTDEVFETHLGKHMEISAQHIPGENGSPGFTMHVIRDVSERKRLEEDLRRSEERYRLFYENAGEAIYTYDRDLTLTGVNRVACEILGYEREELIGRQLQQAGLLHPGDVEKAFSDISRIFAGEPVVRDRLRFIRGDGSILLADVTGAGLYRGDEIIGVTNIALDITERVAAEEAVLKKSQQLKDLVDIAAHEIRHPVAVLKGYAVTLLAYGGSIDSQMTRDALVAIDRASDRLAEMVGQLLDTSSIERDRYEVVMREVEPDEVVLEAVVEMRAKGLENEFVLRRALKGGTFIADGEKVRQAVLILLDNAARYSPAGSEVELWYEWRRAEVVFSVADRGPGLSEADRRNVFERFYQVEDVAHHSGPGLGLGLYIASRIAEAHGGWIKADPRPGGGSVFSFGLPARPPALGPPGMSGQ